MSNLPDEILVDILSRLPTKSIARFRCVSKTWKTLFHHHSFIRAHLHHSINHTDPSLFIMYADKDVPKRNSTPFVIRKVYSILSAEETANSDRGDVAIRNFPPFSPSSETFSAFSFVGCSNGLICLASPYCYPEEAIHIWNPSLHEYFTLPPPPTHLYEFHQLVTYGFGFDATTDDYKVVKFVFGCITEVWYEIEVYRFTKGYWETISQVVPSNLDYISTGDGVSLNGSIHWLGHDNAMEHRIVVFDLACETFGEISLPHYSGCGAGHLRLLKGHLVFFLYHRFEYCELWVMKEYGVHRSWVKEHVIETDTFLLSRPLGFSWTGEILLASMGGRLISYDPESEQVKDFGIFVGARSCSVTFLVDSLISCSGLARPSEVQWKS